MPFLARETVATIVIGFTWGGWPFVIRRLALEAAGAGHMLRTWASDMKHEHRDAFIIFFVVAMAVAISVRHLRLPYTVGLVFAGLALGLAHLFPCPRARQVVAVFSLPAGPDLRSRLPHRFRGFVAQPRHNHRTRRARRRGGDRADGGSLAPLAATMGSCRASPGVMRWCSAR